MTAFSWQDKTLAKFKSLKASACGQSKAPYFIEYSAHFFYIENDAEIFPVHYTWKVAEKGFKVAFMKNKLGMIISFEIILEK